MTRVRIIVGGLVLLGAALLTGAFFTFFERVEEVTEVGFSGEAQVNDYYAAELFLGELGVASDSRYGLGKLPPRDHVLIVLASDQRAREPLTDRLYDWVSSGGHLVVVAARESRAEGEGGDDGPDGGAAEQVEAAGEPPNARSTDLEDPLLELAGIFVERARPKPAPVVSEDDAADPEGPKPPPRGRQTVTVRALGGGEDLQVKIDQSRVLAAESESESEDGLSFEERVPIGSIARVPVGEGTVTAVVDPGFMSNVELGDNDHARLLVDLVSLEGLPSGAIFVIRGEPHSLASLIFGHGWMILVTLACLLAFWVWMSSRRFGPVLAVPPRVRRSLVEHVEAAGAFLWGQGHHVALLESTRQAVRDRLAARLPAAANLEGGELAEAVSQETGMRVSRVHEAFYGGKPGDRRAFTNAMLELQRLWKER